MAPTLCGTPWRSDADKLAKSSNVRFLGAATRLVNIRPGKPRGPLHGKNCVQGNVTGQLEQAKRQHQRGGFRLHRSGPIT